MRVLGLQRTGMAPANIGRWESLESYGVDVALICATRWDEGGVLIEADQSQSRVPLFPLKAIPSGYGPYYVYLPSIARIVRQFEPDLIHFREEVFTVCGGQFLLEKSIGFSEIPFLFESHQNIRKRYPWPARWFEQMGYRRSVGAVAGIPSVEGVLRQGGYGGPIEMIPLGGVNTSLFRPEGPNVRDTFTSNGALVGYVGRLAPEKGVIDLVRALTGVPATLLLVGDGPQAEELATLGREQGTRTIFAGGVEQLKLPEFLRAFDVLVLPSRTTQRWKEQWGRVLTEAMACGTPVIGSDSGEIPWVIGDAGLTYAEGAVEELREAIQRVVNDAALASRLKEAGFERAAEFSWDRHARRTAEFYQRLLS